MLRSHPRESAGAGLLVLAVAASVAAVADPSGAVPLRPDSQASTPAVQELTPFAVRKVAAGEAQRLNAALPLASGPNPAAAPFVIKAGSQTYTRALECLTQAIYYEAAREGTEGQRAVAQVILNRTRHPAYPASVCAVVYQGAERPTGCQFSFTCDGSLYRQPMRSYWDRASIVAQEALRGYVHAPVGHATHYHADYVMPYWAPTLVKNAVIGAHIFYRWPGGWGRPTAFTQRWTKRESDPRLLRAAALVAEARHDSDPALASAEPAIEEPEIVVQARQKLPPELAKLVEAEIGATGETRVGMTVPGKSEGAASKAGPSSSTLDWALSGKGPEQPALGAKPSGEPAAAD